MLCLFGRNAHFLDGFLVAFNHLKFLSTHVLSRIMVILGYITDDCQKVWHSDHANFLRSFYFEEGRCIFNVDESLDYKVLMIIHKALPNLLYNFGVVVLTLLLDFDVFSC